MSFLILTWSNWLNQSPPAQPCNLAKGSEHYRKLKPLIEEALSEISEKRKKGKIGKEDIAHALFLHGLIFEFDESTYNYLNNKIDSLWDRFHTPIGIEGKPGTVDLLTDLSVNIPGCFSHLSRDPGLVKAVDNLLDRWLSSKAKTDREKIELVAKNYDELNDLIKYSRYKIGNRTKSYPHLSHLLYDYKVERALQMIPHQFSPEKMKVIEEKLTNLAEALHQKTDDFFARLSLPAGHLGEIVPEGERYEALMHDKSLEQKAISHQLTEYRMRREIVDRFFSRLRRGEVPREEIAFFLSEETLKPEDVFELPEEEH